jgi:hypothetical protein
MKYAHKSVTRASRYILEGPYLVLFQIKTQRQVCVVMHSMHPALTPPPNLRHAWQPHPQPLSACKGHPHPPFALPAQGATPLHPHQRSTSCAHAHPISLACSKCGMTLEGHPPSASDRAPPRRSHCHTQQAHHGVEATPVNPHPWHISQPHPTHQAEELRARTLRQSTESTMGLAGHLASTPATSWLPRLKAARSLNPPKEDHEDQLTTPKAQLHQHQPSSIWHSRAHKPAPLPPCWLPRTMAATLPNSAWRNARAQHHQGESR